MSVGRVAVMLCGLLMATPLIAHADDDMRTDHEQARALVAAGEIMPLSEVIKQAQTVRQGRVLEVELHHEDEHGGYVYELELIAPDGSVWEIELNATNGELIEAKRED